MNTLINELIQFGLNQSLIEECDRDYSTNLLLDLFKMNSFYKEDVYVKDMTATRILEGMLDYAIKERLIEDTISQKEILDNRIMNCLMPRNSEIIKEFYRLYNENPVSATQYYYNLSIASNYIRKDRTDKNISFKRKVKYGEIEITINLSKPEKDPKEIAKAKTIKQSGYPKCLLCKENVGYIGNISQPSRLTHRIIPMTLGTEQYYMQYSPYVYYNEHCIVFNNEHKPMTINRTTFEHLFDFIQQFPHYMLGSNADLPIVGGSILTHDHYQGGHYHFPIEQAHILKTMVFKKYQDIKVEIVEWPLSTIRLTSANISHLVDLSDEILQYWIEYSDESLDIISHTHGERHNTITPIARRIDTLYQIDLVLRNNRTTDEFPLGIFHPHQQYHHIKKENIGLIEVMGLAILPARLKDELSLIEKCLLGELEFEQYHELEKHKDWYSKMKDMYTFNKENVKGILEQEVADIFTCVLEDAGVYKNNQDGLQGMHKFLSHWEVEE